MHILLGQAVQQQGKHGAAVGELQAVERLKVEHNKALRKLQAEHDEAVSTLQAEHDAAVSKLLAAPSQPLGQC